MVRIWGMGLFFPCDFRPHLAMAIEETAFIDDEQGGDEGSREFARRMDLNPFLRMKLSLNTAVDDDGVYPYLSLNECGLTHNQSAAFEDFSLKSSIQAEDTLKSHLPFK